MKINGSWKTIVFGTGGLLIIIANTLVMLMDNDPNTNPDWNITITAIVTNLGLLFAKDANLSNAPHPTKNAKKV